MPDDAEDAARRKAESLVAESLHNLTDTGKLAVINALTADLLRDEQSATGASLTPAEPPDEDKR